MSIRNLFSTKFIALALAAGGVATLE